MNYINPADLVAIIQSHFLEMFKKQKAFWKIQKALMPSFMISSEVLTYISDYRPYTDSPCIPKLVAQFIFLAMLS